MLLTASVQEKRVRQVTPTDRTTKPPTPRVVALCVESDAAEAEGSSRALSYNT